MSDWALSLGYTAADRFPDSDQEAEDDDPLVKQPPAQLEVDERLVKFTETPFTIAARNAQFRKARLPAFPTADIDALSGTDSRQRGEIFDTHSAVYHPFQSRRPSSPAGKVSAPISSSTNSQRQNETLEMPVRVTPTLAKRNESNPSSVQHRARNDPIEVIIVSSDSEEEENASIISRPGTAHTAHQPTASEKSTQPHKSSSAQALQQLFEENSDFYQSLDREMAQHATSQASCSVQMESLVPDGSTSHDTSSYAPTQSFADYPARYQPPHAPASTFYHPSYASAPFASTRTYLHAPNAVLCPATPVYTPVEYDPYGRIWQSPHHNTPPQLAPMMGYPPAYPPAPAHSSGRSGWQPRYERPWNSPSPHSPPPHALNAHSYGQAQAGPSTYAQQMTPRQAQAARQKADMVLEALKESSKRARTKSSNHENAWCYTPKTEDEWSTLKASRVGPDGTLSLTAAMRRPLPITRLVQSSRGGSRLALPLYRTPGSSAEARRRAEYMLQASSSKLAASESGTTSASSKLTTAAPKASKLFRPSPLEEVGQSNAWASHTGDAAERGQGTRNEWKGSVFHAGR